MEKTCKFCGKPLAKSVYSRDRKYKSCPRCSQSNGEYHVFYRYPSDFGTTELRATQSCPDGPQSYCAKCRSSQKASGGILCTDIEQEDE